jgi:hypothetical protein
VGSLSFFGKFFCGGTWGSCFIFYFWPSFLKKYRGYVRFTFSSPCAHLCVFVIPLSVCLSFYLGIFSSHGDACSEGSVDREDDCLRGRRDDRQCHVEHRVVTANQHPDREDPVSHCVLKVLRFFLDDICH